MQVKVIPQHNTQAAREPAAGDVLALFADLEMCARDRGVGPSEWYEVRNRPLLDVLRCVGALETPSSTGAGSSS